MYVDANLLIGMKIGYMLGLLTIALFWLAWKIFEHYSTQEWSDTILWLKHEAQKRRDRNRNTDPVLGSGTGRPEERIGRKP